MDDLTNSFANATNAQQLFAWFTKNEINSTPTFAVVKGGKVIKMFDGFTDNVDELFTLSNFAKNLQKES